jgi:FkbM family methyltransferase
MGEINPTVTINVSPRPEFGFFAGTIFLGGTDSTNAHPAERADSMRIEESSNLGREETYRNKQNGSRFERCAAVGDHEAFWNKKTPGRTLLNWLQQRWGHLTVGCALWRHCANFWLILLLRLGVVKLPYFVYRIRKEDRDYAFLARPTTSRSGDIFVLREVLILETYQDALAAVNARDIRLVDVGANLGSFTVWVNSVVGVREAFCFEPEPDSFRLLSFNLSLNGCGGAKALEFAAGGTERITKIAFNRNYPAGANLYDSMPEGKSVSVVSFGKWLDQTGGNFDLLKMDCEGAEWEIIRQTDPRQFARFRVVVAEVHKDPEKIQEITEFGRSMERLGFRTIRWDNKTWGLYVGIRDVLTTN